MIIDSNILKILGKTIISAKYRGIDGCDDIPYLDINFSDGSTVTIVADYGGHTGKSEAEYRREIYIE